MWYDKAKIEHLNTTGRRIIAVSDIHANLPYFKGLIKKIKLSPYDVLILNGDFLEKGEDSLATLRFIMELGREYDVHPICGNCDSWADLTEEQTYFPLDRILKYILFRGSGILYDMLCEMGVELKEGLDLAPYMPELKDRFREEWDFLRKLPQIIETPHYTFVHGGVKPDLPYEEQMAGDCMKFDNFMEQGYIFDKWVIVGHWPVMLYLPDHVCANPIINEKQHIISIDGGCTLKDDGQLNALIIPYEGSEDFSFVSYDKFPVKTVVTPQKKGEKSYYIRWGDNKVKVLSRGGEFSLCRHIRTGYEMEILTKYLYSEEEETTCNDSTDLVLELNPGDEVSVIETTSRGFLVKHKGTSGWYFGELR
ncbi:MAG: metallophosphoesterase [Bacillota bacterium]|nr:metallophosphoesterase [Bacillota bacterium]